MWHLKVASTNTLFFSINDPEWRECISALRRRFEQLVQSLSSTGRETEAHKEGKTGPLPHGKCVLEESRRSGGLNEIPVSRLSRSPHRCEDTCNCLGPMTSLPPPPEPTHMCHHQPLCTSRSGCAHTGPPRYTSPHARVRTHTPAHIATPSPPASRALPSSSGG